MSPFVSFAYSFRFFSVGTISYVPLQGCYTHWMIRKVQISKKMG
jgi:hypothetical protein